MKLTHLKKTHSLQLGFTLVELMITIAIISVVSAIAIPAYNGYITEARVATARTNIDSLKLFLEDYRLDNDCYSINCSGSQTITGLTAIEGNYGWNPRKSNSDINYAISLTNTTYTISATYSTGWVNCTDTGNCTSSAD